jgi:hypothetical protein
MKETETSDVLKVFFFHTGTYCKTYIAFFASKKYRSGNGFKKKFFGNFMN